MLPGNRTLYPALAFLLAGIHGAAGAVDAQQAARLGADLTPLGAEKAGTPDGTIPDWTGGLTTPPPGFSPGMHHIDPFASDPVLFTITGANSAKYKDRLSPGQLALLAAHPDYRMPVYPTHRSAATPRSVYDATRANAVTAHLEPNGQGVRDAIGGVPFPIPQNGEEAIWNHLLRYRGRSVERTILQAAPAQDGSYTPVKFNEVVLFNYYLPGMTADSLNNVAFYFRQRIEEPRRLAGSVLLVHETLDLTKGPRRAWIYSVGRRTVRSASRFAYDNPGTAADGLRTSDQFDMFNGAIDRYNWVLEGKREMYVPYNSYRLDNGNLKYSEILMPLHLNQDLARYELHRVWVVEADLKPGMSHIYPKRVFYIDEDSWQILGVDHYDAKGQLWRVSEAHPIEYYEVPAFSSTVEVHYDLQADRYIAVGLSNEEEPCRFDVKTSREEFLPSSLAADGAR